MKKRDIWLITGALAAALVFGAGLFWGRAIPTGAWGLRFGEPGQQPAGNAAQADLAQYGAAYLGDPQEKVLYLTFDAGYENGCTGKILDTLKQEQVPAAFFLAGHYLDANPDLVRRMAQEGHIVGNHTVHHKDMSQITDPDLFAQELTGLEDKYRQITGQEMPKFYRPPQGVYSRENLKQAQEMGYRTVFWSLAHVDWNQDQPEGSAALKKLLSRTHPGAVVLLHSTSQTNADILPQLIQGWREAGYRFASIEELFS